MSSGTDPLERAVLHAFRYACWQERLDIAEFMLAALEKLDQEHTDHVSGDRPLMDAYRDLTSGLQHRKN
ncbi:hypothetical protein [Thalassospira lucentensis]|uniref:hypothetical protein n=1 Tax=Thalassospira lucentensis TaxID=168935 RepID=UPI0003B78691|nr:hypothetical protein [Thalassospira lucentensis]RCK23791.1 hypothetical protein TH1_15490 [Thalassospira lucentensis MCCC 1A00383 = DSM 14000]